MSFSDTGGIRLRLPVTGTLISDRPEMLVDAKHDEHGFGNDARNNDAHERAEYADDQKDHADERVERHGIERSDHPDSPEQQGNNNSKPIEHFDHGGRYE